MLEGLSECLQILTSLNADSHHIFYYYYLEDNDMLQVSDDVSMFCLQYVFIPRINSALTQWTNAWIHHPLSSEGSRTPMQLLSVVKAGPTTQCSSDHIFEIVTYESMKFCRHVVLYESYMLNKFGGHVTFWGGVIV